jgi:hypothetical protein
MNPFEKFMNPGKPDPSEQFEESVMEEYSKLIDDAKIKAEGVLLYAPIPEEVRKKLLEYLQEIKIDDEATLKSFFKYEERGSGLERTASLYIDRKIRGAISMTESTLGRDEAEKLMQAIAHLYTNPSEYGDLLHKDYMNRNIGTEKNN